MGEEIANSITHGLGVVLSTAALVILVVLASKRGDAWRMVSFSIYGATLILLYLSSTLYHSFVNPKVKNIFRILDHLAIYLLIAGSYTPITLVSMRGAWGWTLFGLIWGMAIAGIIISIAFKEKLKPVMVLSYVVMGLLIVVAFKPMLLILPQKMIFCLFIGGAFYLLGIIFYLWKRLPYHHPIWHLFVLGGSISHFFGILFYLT
ncbi:hemolysin III [Candidatus Atribacteria bacterium CG2_30_33_13]|uniref:Hemolysin III n=1 Tax=Candidatus Infernicultor aquiphilus TaxID=1805029 RepID=A0A1J5G939_9BACT|nr:MAG: hemolysin III [Candidatus Atribacteria bacterium CG2_30_33_13]